MVGKLSSVQEDTDEVRHTTFLWPRRLFYQSADFTTSLSCTNTIQKCSASDLISCVQYFKSCPVETLNREVCFVFILPGSMVPH